MISIECKDTAFKSVGSAIRRITNTYQNKNKSLALTLMILLFVSSVFTYSLHYELQNEKRIRTEFALDNIRSDIQSNSEMIASLVLRIEPIVEQLAKDLSSGKLSVNSVDQRIISDLSENTWMYGMGMALEPSVYPDRSITEDGPEYFSSHYVVSQDNSVKQASIMYDYTAFEHTWYRKPILEGNTWLEPFYGKASQALLTFYGVPFWLPGRNREQDPPSGMVFGDLSIEKLKKLTHLDEHYLSYYYLISKEGRFILHPNNELPLSGATLFETAWQKEDSSLNTLAIRAVEGDSGYINHTDPVSNEKSWVVYNSLPKLAWSLIYFIDKDRSVNNIDERKQWLQLIFFITISSIFFLLLLHFTIHTRWHNLLTTSIVISMFIFVGIAMFWIVAEKFEVREKDTGIKLQNNNSLNNYINNQKKHATKLNLSQPKFIRTGVYLQSMDFTQANSVNISGYIWQKYEKEQHKGISRGFILPEAESVSIKEVFHESARPEAEGCKTSDPALRDCDELIGWYVFGTLKQEFDYSLYPIDTQKVWLKLWHQDFKKNHILVPDLEAYDLPNPILKPGVQKGFILPGWDIEASWFTVNQQSFNTNFGSASSFNIDTKPELFYNVKIQRKFINPFVSRIIPVALILIIMYLIVLISTKSSEASEWLGFSASNVVLGLSALLFVAVINHSELRQVLKSPKIMYFEYFYFVNYIMLLYVAISSIYIAQHSKPDQHRENLISKVLYWPSVSITLFIITFWVLY